MKILSRNINGIRAIWNKWFVDTIQTLNPDIVCLQEPKAFVSQLTDQMKDLWLWYHLLWHTGTRPGYAGTCIYSRQTPDYVINHFDNPNLHIDGRTVEIGYQGLTLINCYFPNGGTRADGTEMLTYKMQFYDLMMSYLNTKSHHTMIVGDFNIAHTEQDIARPQENINTIWFTVWERNKLTQFLDQWWVDTFRHYYPDTVEYTWRSVRSWARARNIWWRLDYACVHQDLLSSVQSIIHHTHILWSDHCPVEIVLN